VKSPNVPPLLVSFSQREKFIAALDEETRSSQGAEIVSLVEKGLPPAVSVRAVSVLFGIHPQFLGSVLVRPEKYYRKFTLPKGRGKRVIYAPRVVLKNIQRWIGFHLSRNIPFPRSVVGFVPGRSTFDGALPHCGSDWVFSTDIVEFFPSTSSAMIVQSLMKTGFSKRSAELISTISSINNGLAQGSPASPVLANLAFSIVDERIQLFCRVCGYTYSRYADDVVISGKGQPPEGLKEKLEGFLVDTSWKISNEKSILSVKPKRLKVFGLLVNGSAPRLTNGYRNRIRAIRHLIRVGKIEQTRLMEGKGHLAYADSIEKRRSQLSSGPTDEDRA